MLPTKWRECNTTDAAWIEQKIELSIWIVEKQPEEGEEKGGGENRKKEEAGQVKHPSTELEIFWTIPAVAFQSNGPTNLIKFVCHITLLIKPKKLRRKPIDPFNLKF